MTIFKNSFKNLAVIGTVFKCLVEISWYPGTWDRNGLCKVTAGLLRFRCILISESIRMGSQEALQQSCIWSCTLHRPSNAVVTVLLMLDLHRLIG